MLQRFSSVFLLIAAVAATPGGQTAAQTRRPLQPDDVFALKDVGDPRVSPDGAWVAYTVTTLDRKEDNSDTDIYMVARRGRRRRCGSPRATRPRRRRAAARTAATSRSSRRATARRRRCSCSTGAAARPRSSPTTRPASRDLAWSPDGRSLALVVSDADPDAPTTDEDGATAGDKKPRSRIVITRLQFKRDGDGYLNDVRATSTSSTSRRKNDVQLTSGPLRRRRARPGRPTASCIAFMSNRTRRPGRERRTRDIFVVEPREGARRARSTTRAGDDGAPVFSPDGKSIAYLAGGDPKDIWYATNHVAVVPVAGGAAEALTAALDRNVSRRSFAPDGRASCSCSRTAATATSRACRSRGGAVERVVAGERDVAAFDVGEERRRSRCSRASRSSRPRVSRASSGRRALRRALTHVNDEFLARHRARPRRALQGEERRRHDASTASSRGRPTRRGRHASCPRSCASTAGPVVAVLDRVQARVADARRPRLRGRRRQPARLVRLRHATSAARSGPTGATRTTTT